MNMGWLPFRIMGADPKAQEAYKLFCKFTTLLELDIQVMLSLLLLAAFSRVLGDVELGLSIAGAVAELIWAMLG